MFLVITCRSEIMYSQCVFAYSSEVDNLYLMLYSHLHKLDIKFYAMIFCARSTMYNMMLSTE